MLSRRTFTRGLGALSLAYLSAPFSKNLVDPSKKVELSGTERSRHEIFMRLAIEQARKNKPYPFGAVIVNEATGEILAEGVNAGGANPVHHGEIVTINHYIEKHGSLGFDNATLYSTGEPCAMCMGAIIWCSIPTVVWASSITKIRESGIPQIAISAVEIAQRASEFYRPRALIAGVLADEADLLFNQRKNR